MISHKNHNTGLIGSDTFIPQTKKLSSAKTRGELDDQKGSGAFFYPFLRMTNTI
jgi:hypothetical protein